MAFNDGDNGENFMTIMGLKQFTNMKKEIKITPPEGYEIDKENSTFECIKFKPIVRKRWRDGYHIINGFFINGSYVHDKSWETSYNIFATEKQAKSALAMAQISQIMANDERFGGVVTDEEWELGNYMPKHVIDREKTTEIVNVVRYKAYSFLAFHTAEQRDLFLEENEDLVKDYLMID